MKTALKHETPFYDSYRYIPAALCMDQYCVSVYVRYRRSKTPNDIVVKQKDASMCWLVCPDRELVITTHSFDVLGFHPNDFDMCLHLDMFNQQIYDSMGINYVMNNFVHDKGYRSSADSRAKGNIYPLGHEKRVSVVGDSGGFQYVSGAIDYVNPQELGKWYSSNVDSGMQLDIPITVPLEDKVLKDFAKFQIRNNRMVTEHLADHVDLFNVIHGKTINQRLMFKDIIEKAFPDAKCMGLGGMRSFGSLGTANLMANIVGEGKRYAQYHLLGITSSNLFPVLICMAGLNPHSPHITSDSASHKLAAKSRKMYVQSEPGKLRMIDIGNKNYQIQAPGVSRRPRERQYYTGVTNNLLKSNNIICNTIKYADVLGILTGQFSTTLLSIHNLLETNSYVNVVKEVFASEKLEDFMSFIKKTHATNSPADSADLAQALDFMRDVNDVGYAKAYKKYSRMINKENEVYTDQPQGLLGNVDSGNATTVSKKEETERLLKLKETAERNLKLLEKGKPIPKSKKESTSEVQLKGW